MSFQSTSGLISGLFRADFRFDRSETVMKQLMDFSRHRGRAGPSATAHSCCSVMSRSETLLLDEALDIRWPMAAVSPSNKLGWGNRWRCFPGGGAGCDPLLRISSFLYRVSTLLLPPPPPRSGGVASGNTLVCWQNTRVLVAGS